MPGGVFCLSLSGLFGSFLLIHNSYSGYTWQVVSPTDTWYKQVSDFNIICFVHLFLFDYAFLKSIASL